MSDVDMYDLKCEHGITSQEELFERIEGYERKIKELTSENAALSHLLSEIEEGDKIVGDAMVDLYNAVAALTSRSVQIDEAVEMGRAAMAKASFVKDVIERREAP